MASFLSHNPHPNSDFSVVVKTPVIWAATAPQLCLGPHKASRDSWIREKRVRGGKPRGHVMVTYQGGLARLLQTVHQGDNIVDPDRVKTGGGLTKKMYSWPQPGHGQWPPAFSCRLTTLPVRGQGPVPLPQSAVLQNDLFDLGLGQGPFSIGGSRRSPPRSWWSNQCAPLKTHRNLLAQLTVRGLRPVGYLHAVNAYYARVRGINRRSISG